MTAEGKAARKRKYVKKQLGSRDQQLDQLVSSGMVDLVRHVQVGPDGAVKPLKLPSDQRALKAGARAPPSNHKRQSRDMRQQPSSGDGYGPSGPVTGAKRRRQAGWQQYDVDKIEGVFPSAPADDTANTRARQGPPARLKR